MDHDGILRFFVRYPVPPLKIGLPMSTDCPRDRPVWAFSCRTSGSTRPASTKFTSAGSGRKERSLVGREESPRDGR